MSFRRAHQRLILSLSKDEASHGGGAASSFDKLRMRPNGTPVNAPKLVKA